MKIEIYTDGSCSLNNIDNIEKDCEGGFGFCVLQDGNLIYEYFEGWHQTTNNRMEMRAIIKALEYCYNNYPEADITIYSDSAYIVNCLKQKWYKKWMSNGWRNSKRESVKNVDLWKEMLHYNYNWIMKDQITVEKVTGHSNNKWNKYADQLANKWRIGNNEDFNTDKESSDRSSGCVPMPQQLF